MRENSFGALCRAAIILWSLLWGAVLFKTCANVGALQPQLGDTAVGVGVAFGFMLYGGIWMVGAAGILIVYLLLGRSGEPAPRTVTASAQPPEPAPPPVDERTCLACLKLVDASAAFCSHCGAAMPGKKRPVFCSACGAALGANTRSCPKCEAAIGG